MPASFQAVLPLPGSFTLQRARALVFKQQRRVASAKSTELSSLLARHPLAHPPCVLLPRGPSQGNPSSDPASVQRKRRCLPAQPCKRSFKHLESGILSSPLAQQRHLDDSHLQTQKGCRCKEAEGLSRVREAVPKKPTRSSLLLSCFVFSRAESTCH